MCHDRPGLGWSGGEPTPLPTGLNIGQQPVTSHRPHTTWMYMQAVWYLLVSKRAWTDCSTSNTCVLLWYGFGGLQGSESECV
jgi:hypothetical protein